MSIFGAVVSNPQVEQATIATLGEWLDTYLREIERQNELAPLPRPPAPESVHGGLDFLSFIADQSPELVVVVNPTGEPEYDESVGYGQWFEIQVAAIVLESDENQARDLAGYYGAAIMALIDQQPALGGIAVRTRLVGAPRTDFMDPDIRNVVRCVVVFHSFVEPIVVENAGPDFPGSAPDDRAPVQQVTTTVTGESLQ